MKRKYYFVILFLVLAMFLSGCSGSSILSANFIITNWEQSYSEYSEEWSNYVYVYYSITNTGNIEIDYYQVYFEVTCADGSKYEEWTNGMFIDVGHTENDYTLILVNGKKAVSVKVSEYELDSFGW